MPEPKKGFILFRKNGYFSKTAFILIFTWFIVLVRYILGAGTKTNGRKARNSIKGGHMKNLWKWILGIIGAVFFVLLGVNLFSSAQDDRAWKKYKKDKEEFDKIRTGLDDQNEADKQKLKELEKQKEAAEKAFLKRSAESKEEAAKIENMNAAELAEFTTKKEKEIRKRLEL